MIPFLIGGALALVTGKNKKTGLSGSWHAKGNKYRHTTDEKQQLKKGYKYIKGGDIVNTKTGKVYTGKKQRVLKKKPKAATKKVAPKKSTKNPPKTNKIEVLKTSGKGASLITDGIKTAWIMPRQKRKDGTFTAGALKALNESPNLLSDYKATGKTSSKKLAYMVKYDMISRETDKAMLVTSFNGSEDWLPKSAVHNSPSNSLKSDSILVEAWALKNKDIQYSTKKKYYV